MACLQTPVTCSQRSTIKRRARGKSVATSSCVELPPCVTWSEVVAGVNALFDFMLSFNGSLDWSASSCCNCSKLGEVTSTECRKRAFCSFVNGAVVTVLFVMLFRRSGLNLRYEAHAIASCTTPSCHRKAQKTALRHSATEGARPWRKPSVAAGRSVCPE